MDVAVVVVTSVVVAVVVMALCGAVFVAAFDLSLLRAQFGCKTPFMCSFSLCSRCGLEQTVLTLYVRVLNTLYIANRMWWLS